MSTNQGVYVGLKASTTEAGVVTDAASADGAIDVSPATRSFVFMLAVTAAATDSGDVLTVQIEGSIDGTNWVECVTFATHAGDVAAEEYYEPLTIATNASGFLGSAAQGAASALGVVFRKYRVKWSIAETGGNASFTFEVGAYFA